MSTHDRLVQDLKQLFKHMEDIAPTRHSDRTDQCLSDPQLVAIASGKQAIPSDKAAHVESCRFCQRYIHMEFLPEEEVARPVPVRPSLWEEAFRAARTSAQQLSDWVARLEKALTVFEPTLVADPEPVFGADNPPYRFAYKLGSDDPGKESRLEISIYSGEQAREIYQLHKTEWSDHPHKEFCIIEFGFNGVVKEPAVLLDEHDVTEYLQYENELGLDELRCYLILDGLAEFRGVIMPHNLDETLVIRLERIPNRAQERVLVACFSPDKLGIEYRFASRRELVDPSKFLRSQGISSAWWRDRIAQKWYFAPKTAWKPDRVDYLVAEARS